MNLPAEARVNELSARLKAFGMMIKLGSDLYGAPDFETAAGMAVNSSFRLLRYKSSALVEVTGGKGKVVAQYAQTEINAHAELTEAQAAFAAGALQNVKENLKNFSTADLSEVEGAAAEALASLTAEGEEYLAIRLLPPPFLGKVDFQLIWLIGFEKKIPAFAVNSASILMHSFGAALYCHRCCRVPVQQRLKKQVSPGRVWIAVLVLAALLLLFFPVRNTVNTEFVLKAPEIVSVYGWFDGPVAECRKQDGAKVEKGEVIACYDKSQIRFRLANAESQYREIEKEYELESSAAFSDRERLGRAQLIAARLEGARVAVEEARWYLEHAELKAPRDGILALADGRAELLINKALRTGDRVFDVYSGQGAVAEIQVDQREGSVLQGKVEASLFLYTEPDRELKCEITDIRQYPILNEQRVYCYKVLAKVADSPALRYGMRGIAKLRGDRVSLGYYLFKNLVIYLRWL